MRYAELFILLLLLGVSSTAYAQTTEQSSKIEGYTVLNATGPQAAKLNGYVVLDAKGPQLSKTTGYAVLANGPRLSKLEDYAVLNNPVPFGDLGLSKTTGYAVLAVGPRVSKLEGYAVLNNPAGFSAIGLPKLEGYAVLLDPTYPPGGAPCAPGSGNGNGPVLEYSNSSDAYPSSFTSPATVAITTTQTDEIIYVGFSIENFNSSSTSPAPTITSLSDTASLVWHLRDGIGYTCNGGIKCAPFVTGSNVNLYWYWAYAPTPLTGDVLSVNYSVSPSRWNILLSAWTGVANFAAPFDADPSLPAHNSDMSGATGQPTATYATVAHGTATIPIDGSGAAVWAVNADALAAASGDTEVAYCFDWVAGVTQCTGNSAAADAVGWKTITIVGGVPTAVLTSWYRKTGACSIHARPWVWIEQ